MTMTSAYAAVKRVIPAGLRRWLTGHRGKRSSPKKQPGTPDYLPSGLANFTSFRMPKDIGPSDIAEIQFGRMQRQLALEGWIQSAVERRPVGKKRKPVPWYTYPCTHFLNERVTRDLDVFEYGSGYSTLWWAERVRSVTSCEHNKAFYEEINARRPDNVTYILHDSASQGTYAGVPASQGRKFDVIIIDGEDRVQCALEAPNALSDTGVIVWDNANRKRYQAGYDHLKALGFRKLDFTGHGPIWVKEWSTAVFYRERNCLDL